MCLELLEAGPGGTGTESPQEAWPELSHAEGKQTHRPSLVILRVMALKASLC